jgi:uncharacterized protein (TIGR03545 family)
MIRWKYLAPRLLLLAVSLLVLAMLVDPLIKHMLVSGGQSLVGAKVEIDAVITSIPSGRILVRNLRVANPRSPMHNLFEASQAHLQVDTKALLAGRLVIRDGSLQGLQFSTDRDSLGSLPAGSRPGEVPDFEHTLPDWLAHFRRQVDAEWLEEFESARVARELIERWPMEAQRLLADAEALQGRVKSIRDAVEQAQRKPLENLAAVQRALNDAAVLRADAERLRRRLADLQERAQEDRKSLEFAQRRDVAKIEEGLRMASLDGQVISEFLLGPELSPYVRSALQWVATGRKWLAAAGDPPRPARGQGITVPFPREPAGPDWLVHRLAVSGETELGNRRVPFQGTLRGICSDPKLYAHPSQLSLRFDGVHPAQLEVVVDARRPVTVQRLAFNCPNISLGKRSVGREQQLLVELDEGTGHLWMQVELRDDDVQGRLIWKQDQIRLAATVGERYGGPQMAKLLDAALRDATHLHAVLELHGTLQEPQVNLNASIGPQLARAWNVALRQELERQRDIHVARLQVQIAQQLARLDEDLAARQQQIFAKLDFVGELESWETLARRSGANPLPANVRGLIPAAAGQGLETGMRRLESGVRQLGTRR